MRKSNYDKMPATVVDGTLWKGWESIRKRLAEIHAETNGSQVWVVECYQGVHHEELMRASARARSFYQYARFI